MSEYRSDNDSQYSKSQSQQSFQSKQQHDSLDQSGSQLTQGMKFKSSQHEEIVQEYLKRTKLEAILLSAIREVIEGDFLPKNPYCSMTKTVVQMNMKQQLIANFEKLSKVYRKNNVPPEGPYQITSIGNDFKVYGLRSILELLDIQFLQIMFQSIDEILPELHFPEEDGLEIEISNSVSGGLIFQSDLIPFSQSHPKDLEIFTEVFITCGNLNQAIDSFAQFVHDDIKSVTNIEDMHIVKEFIFYGYSEKSTSKNQKKGWSIEEILLNSNGFLHDIKTHVQNKDSIYWKGYMRVEKFTDKKPSDNPFQSYSRPGSNFARKRQSQRNLQKKSQNDYMFDLNREKTYQYIEVYKVYNLHYTDTEDIKNSKSFQTVPLGGLMKGIFLKYDTAVKYASFFYRQDENFKNSDFFKDFAQNQLKLVLKKWQEQNILACSWELFYMALNIEEPDLRRSLVDSILQILTSDLSNLVCLSKTNQILQHIIKLYEKTGNVSILQPIIQSTFDELSTKIEKEIANSSNIDVLKYRDYLRILLKDGVDKQNQLIINETTILILTTINRITKYISLGNLQQVGSITRNVPDYIFHTLQRNQLLKDDDLEFLTYDEFASKKVKHKVIHISQYMLELKRQEQFARKNPVELENSLVLNYLSYYNVYDNIYTFLQNLLFDKLIPNPFSVITVQFEAKALRHTIYDKPSSEIMESFLTTLTPQDVVGNAGRAQFGDNPLKGNQDGNLQADIYMVRTRDMIQQNLDPVFGVQEIVSVAGNWELSMRKKVLDTIHWKQSLTKQLPPGYIINDMLTVQVFEIFSHPLLLQETYVQWDFSWDFIIKGHKEEYARQIYMDIVIRYAYWIEESTYHAVLGFFVGDECKLSYEEIKLNIQTSESRKILGKSIVNGDQIVLKILLKVETEFKILNLFLNYVYIDEYKEPRAPRDIRNQVETYLRLFFRKEEALTWYSIFKYSRLSVTSLIKRCIKSELSVGELGRAMYLELINLFVHENTESFIDNARILFGYSEKLYNHSKQAMVYQEMIQYVKEKPRIESIQKKRKTNMLDIRKIFFRYCERLEKDLYDYENIYMENLGASCLNQVELVKAAFDEDDPKLKSYTARLAKLAAMLDFMADSAVLSFKKMAEIEFDRKFLF